MPGNNFTMQMTNTLSETLHLCKQWHEGYQTETDVEK